MLVLGLHSKGRMSTRDKANIPNPKVNRGCPPLTANRSSADCVQISLGHPIQYIPLRVYRTRGFNAIRLRGENEITLKYQGSCMYIMLPIYTYDNGNYSPPYLDVRTNSLRIELPKSFHHTVGSCYSTAPNTVRTTSHKAWNPPVDYLSWNYINWMQLSSMVVTSLIQYCPKNIPWRGRNCRCTNI